jgi:hypothetical protein
MMGLGDALNDTMRSRLRRWNPLLIALATATVGVSGAMSWVDSWRQYDGWSIRRVEPPVHYSTTRGLRFDAFRLERGDIVFTVRCVSFERDMAEASIIDLPDGLPGTLKAQLDEHQAQVVINGGFWNADFSPVGQVRIGGRDLSSCSMEDVVNGMVAIFRGARLRAMRSNDPDWYQAPSALQTGPVLIGDNGTRVPLSKYVESADRSGIAQDSDRVSIFTTTPASIADLASAMHARPEAFGLHRITFAVALDGGPSSGMAVRLGSYEYIQEPRGRIRNAIVVRGLTH